VRFQIKQNNKLAIGIGVRNFMALSLVATNNNLRRKDE
jgi:hypothetical protein